MPQLRETVLALVALWPTLVAAGPITSRPMSDTVSSTPYYVGCSRKEMKCLSRGLLPFSEDNRCYEPLSQGPCTKESFWFALDPSILSFGLTVTGKCVPRHCPLGEFLYQDRCLNATSARKQLCSGGAVHLDLEGNPRCGDSPDSFSLLQRSISCYPVTQLPNRHEVATVIGVGGKPCATNNAGDCVREVITPSTSRTILQPEED